MPDLRTTYPRTAIPCRRDRRRNARRGVLSLLTAAVVLAGCAGAPELSEDRAELGSSRKPSTPTTRPTPPAPTSTPKGGDPSAPTPSSTFAALSERTIGGCMVHPRDHVLNARNVDTLPKHPMSDAYITFLGGKKTPIKAPSSSVWEGSRPGMPVNVVDSRTTGFTKVQLNYNYTSRSYKGGYPIPNKPLVQGHPTPQWDQHLLMLDVADCTVYELIQYDLYLAELFGLHTALAGTTYPLDTTDRPRMTTNVANTPMIGQYLMLDEVNSGSVDHPVAWCSNITGSGVTWPANMSDGPHDRPDAPPMGTWLRLRGDVDLGRFTGQARPVAEALREHGLILTDTCGHPFSILGENTGGWVKSEMEQIRALTVADFEAVDATPMKISDESLRIR